MLYTGKVSKTEEREADSMVHGLKVKFVFACSSGSPKIKFSGCLVEDGNLGFSDYASSRHPVVGNFLLCQLSVFPFPVKSSQ